MARGKKREVSEQQIRDALKASQKQSYNGGICVKDAAKILGVPAQTLRDHMNYMGISSTRHAVLEVGSDGAELELPTLVDTDLTYEEIKAKRLQEYENHSAAYEQRKLIGARVRRDGPIALFIFGDPHLDDPGTDLKTLYEHTELINNTEGMYAANIGDTLNNWVGRLRTLYANQSTTENEAWKLAEGWIRELAGKWLFLIAGNHDLWSGSGDPLKWICKGVGAHYEAHQYRVALTFPNGSQTIVNSRHDWPGGSQWNPTHGPLKAAELGYRDDIYIAGHKHISGYQAFKAGDGSLVHACRVASYKRYDSYALEKGLRDHIIGPCVVFTIDPHNEGPDRIKHFWDPYAAARYLKAIQ